VTNSSNSKLLKNILLSGALNHALIALLGIFRVPLVIGTFGTAVFASYTASLGFWTLIAAVGESARQRVRIINFSGNSSRFNQKILWQSVGCSLGIGVLTGAFFFYAGGDVAPDLGTFIVAMLCGVIYIPFAMALGRLEGEFRFTSANVVFSVGQLIGFLVTLLGCFTGQIWLVGFSVLLPFFLPGVFSALTYFTNRNRRAEQSHAQVGSVEMEENGSRSLLLAVLFFETLVYAVDGALVLRFAGPTEAATLAIVQRISAVFGILPIIMAPLATALNLKESVKHLSTKVKKIQIYFGLALVVFVMFIGFPLFQFLSNDKLELNPWTLVAASVTGLILASTTTDIQSASSPSLIRVKATTTAILACCNILFTIALCPIIGATAAFLSTGIGQLIYFSVVKGFRRRLD